MENDQSKPKKDTKKLLPVAITAAVALAVGGFMLSQSQTTSPEPAPSSSQSSSPTPSTVAAPASLTAKGGYIVKGATSKANAPEVVIYLDFICPACKQFDHTYGETLQKQAAEGAISLEYRPVSVLDRASTTSYSSRAMHSFACVADTAPNASVKYINKLMKEQPPEGGAGLSDEVLASHAASVGAPDAAKCITDKKFRDWVNTSSDKALHDEGITHTPYVVVNGEVWDTQSDLLQSLSAAGMASADQ